MTDGTLRRILLEADENQAKPLFSTQVELARAIRSLDEGAYPSERGLSSFLGQIITGGRSCPRPLALLLMRAAVDAARQSRGAAGALEVEALLKAALFQKEGGSDVDELLARQVGAELVVIVNPEPQEVRRHPRAADFQKAMCQSLHPGTGEPTGRYMFVLAQGDDDAIAEHWKRTREAFLAALKDENPDATEAEVETLIAKLDAADCLMLVGVPPFACAIPTVAFDPHLRGGWCDVLVWDSYIQDGEPIDKIVRFSPELRMRWVRDFYRGFLLNPANYVRYSFSPKH
jgi:hypothetical protein